LPTKKSSFTLFKQTICPKQMGFVQDKKPSWTNKSFAHLTLESLINDFQTLNIDQNEKDDFVVYFFLDNKIKEMFKKAKKFSIFEQTLQIKKDETDKKGEAEVFEFLTTENFSELSLEKAVELTLDLNAKSQIPNQVFFIYPLKS